MSDALLAAGGGAFGTALVLVIQYAKTVFTSKNGGGNGTAKAVIEAVALANMRKDIDNLLSMKDLLEANGQQMLNLAKEHADFARAYIERHGQLSERIARLEAK